MQLEFLWRDETIFQSELEQRAGEPIEIVLTDNSSSIMSFKSARGGTPARLRIHRMFLAANSSVIEALSVWLTRRRSAKSAAVLDDFIKNNEHLIRENGGRRVRVRTRGAFVDLQRVFDDVNAEHFDNSVQAAITWGRMPGRPQRRRSIRLGSFTLEDNLVRIHPLLNQEFVPEYFIRYIVFHEMLHAHLGVERGPGGRRRVHTPEFNRLERAYPDYAKATAWHDDAMNLNQLLSA
jgi:predicted metal-dependent hydrolase